MSVTITDEHRKLAREFLLVLSDRPEFEDGLARLLAERDRAADERWCKAMQVADWDGGVFHYEGRIYPWPCGFVPDVPATWASKTEAARREGERAGYKDGFRDGRNEVEADVNEDKKPSTGPTHSRLGAPYDMGPFIGERFGDARTGDPDDLAIAVASLLRTVGIETSIHMRQNEAGESIAIEVWRGGHSRVASFDCQPLRTPSAYEALLNRVARRMGLSEVDMLMAEAMAARKKVREGGAVILPTKEEMIVGTKAMQDLLASVRAWAAAECGATEADAVLAKLAAFDDALARRSR